MKITNCSTNYAPATNENGVVFWLSPASFREVGKQVVNGESDYWTTGEAHIYVTADTGAYHVLRDNSGLGDFAYGMQAGLPLAVLMIMIWAVKRGLRPSLEHL